MKLAVLQLVTVVPDTIWRAAGMRQVMRSSNGNTKEYVVLVDTTLNE